tara:strand:+ start:6146 stop:6391 length:246 start_codon:yes stop_codon:yes gene_type:complete
MGLSKVIMDKSSAFASYVASISTAIGGLMSLNNIALLIGIAATLLLSLVQYRVWTNRRKQDDEYHAARMRALNPQDEVSGD